MIKKPDIFNSGFYNIHADILADSCRKLTGKTLQLPEDETKNLLESLWQAPFVLVSHGTEPDPVFNFGNQKALELFELDFDHFTRLPSRYSAESISQEERNHLLKQVTDHGYIQNYTGVRISSTGRRFYIREALVWNLYDHQDQYYGQAAMFDQWEFLP